KGHKIGYVEASVSDKATQTPAAAKVKMALIRGPRRRKDIAEITGLSRTTLTRVKKELKIETDVDGRWKLPGTVSD
ncbi:MAG: hypothetical protein GY869_07995, partial [Planctomycetes bacterium]|nr:hypothetical protein [Planctomycetota bacterium]